AEKWSDTPLHDTAAPPRAMAFVRESRRDGAPADDTATESRKGGGGSAILQRALRRHGGAESPLAKAIATSDAKAAAIDGNAAVATTTTTAVKTESETLTEGKRRAERRRRRLERLLNREGDVHPCVHQGGCAAQGGATLCPFVQYPATMCVAWLRHGRCENAMNGCCPWWHGNVADTPKNEMLAESLFYTPGDAACDGGKLHESCAWMGTLLQMFLDVVVGAIEDAGVKWPKETTSPAEVQQYVVAALRNGSSAAALPVHHDAMRGVLSVERELGICALMTESCAPPAVVAEGVNGEESFDAMFERELAAMRGGRPQQVEEEQQQQRLRDTGEQRLRRVLTTFRGFVIACDEHEASDDRIALCAPLSRWMLQLAVNAYTHGAGNAAEVAPLELFEDACAVLLEHRLHMCGIGKATGEGNNRMDDRRWSALLLLQHGALLAHISASRDGAATTAPATAGGAGVSLLYTTLLAIHTNGGSRWPGDGVQAQCVNCWVLLQSLLSIIVLGILREGVQLFARARSALVAVTRQLASDVEGNFAAPLLQAAGWSAWTDEQMFASQQMMAYTAADYARFHLPTVAHCFVVSTLNVLLLHILSTATHRYQLRQSPVEATLFTSGRGTALPQERIQWERCLRGGGDVRRGVQPYALEAMAILSVLQEESNAVLARRQLLVEEFMSRRKEYRERGETDPIHHRKKRHNDNNNNSSAKKGHLSGNGSGRYDGVEDDNVHILERLLPHGSVMVPADVFSLLLRVLFEGGGAYKALRLAASAIHACRMLRHAARQPLPYIVQGEKTVYKRVRQDGTRRKRVLRVSVPVLRRVDPAGD
ncbi:hypothetical protein DQ04_16631000, partial [Trypanosoma grayi]|uniref:hypothetical protein n=1 Tax=Trypanosoma grayi TaxID=71804 RepID=UPI0004F470BD